MIKKVVIADRKEGGILMITINQKGEGALKTVLLLFILVGAAYAGYVYLWPMLSGPGSQATSAGPTPTPGEAKAGSPAAAAVQGAQAAGELYSSGR